MPSVKKFELTDDDLLGYELSEVECKNCSDMCSCKTPRLYCGRPVVLCGNKDAGRAVLSKLKPRR